MGYLVVQDRVYRLIDSSSQRVVARGAIQGGKGDIGPPQIYLGGSAPVPVAGYALLWAKPADPPTGDPLDHEPVFITSP